MNATEWFLAHLRLSQTKSMEIWPIRQQDPSVFNENRSQRRIFQVAYRQGMEGIGERALLWLEALPLVAKSWSRHKM